MTTNTNTQSLDTTVTDVVIYLLLISGKIYATRPHVHFDDRGIFNSSSSFDRPC